MYRFKRSLVALNLAACVVIISAAPPEGVKQAISIVHESKLDHKSDTKGIPFQFPEFLAHALPKPVVFGNAATQGEVGGLFAANNNTLVSQSGPNGTAIASLNSTSFYFAQPIQTNTSSVSPNGWTNGENLAGFTVTAQEDTQAYAEGEWIQFINHGGSYATGIGESQANGTTDNEGVTGGGQSTGPGWGGSGWRDVPKEEEIPTPIS